MIDPQDIADELIAAEREHKAIGQFSDIIDYDLETAYRAQRGKTAQLSRLLSRRLGREPLDGLLDSEMASPQCFRNCQPISRPSCGG